MANYSDLDELDKLELAIKFVSTDQPLPKALIEFLQEAGLYELVTNPRVIEHVDN